MLKKIMIDGGMRIEGRKEGFDVVKYKGRKMKCGKRRKVNKLEEDLF